MVCSNTESDEVIIMKKILLLIIILFFFIPSQLWAYTCTATKTGNWSDSTVWSGCNSTIPQAGDTVDLVSYTVTWDSHARIPDTSGSLALMESSAGGQFALNLSSAFCNSGCSLNVTTFNDGTNSLGTYLITGTTSNVLTINTGLNSNSQGIILTSGQYMFEDSSTGTININGDLTGGSNRGYECFTATGAGTINITGNINTGLAAYGTAMVFIMGGGTLNVTGNVIGGSGAGGVDAIFTTNGTISVIGNVSGGSTVGSQPRDGYATFGISSNGNSVTVVGNVTGGSGNYSGGILMAGGTLSVTGIITGGTAFGAVGVYYYAPSNQVTLGTGTLLVQGSGASAYFGPSPAWTSSSSNKVQFYQGASFNQPANTTFSTGGGGSSAHSTAY